MMALLLYQKLECLFENPSSKQNKDWLLSPLVGA